MDLNAAYRRGAQENLRNATLTYDPVHVTALVSEAVDEVRRKGTREGNDSKEEALKGSMYLF